eukprot:43917-Eustigmatos_ZCMA.PRE.1
MPDSASMRIPCTDTEPVRDQKDSVVCQEEGLQYTCASWQPALKSVSVMLKCEVSDAVHGR